MNAATKISCAMQARGELREIKNDYQSLPKLAPEFKNTLKMTTPMFHQDRCMTRKRQGGRKP